MHTVPVELAERSYEIQVTDSTPADFGAFARGRSSGTQAMIITDEHVAPHIAALEESLQKAGFEVSHAILPPGEEQKSLSALSRLYDHMAQQKADRRALVVAVGGGVIGDLAGFAAATWNRGIALLMVPTTLLAMVDSSVGGKVGINHPGGKNLIGAFHQPVGVWIDTAYLETLPKREFCSGLAEVVKYGVILDRDFFCYVEEHAGDILDRKPEAIQYVVAQSCRLKAKVVQEDERETLGLRVVLNYGHTFAHAFEAIGGYGQWLHGEAVSAGMVCASKLAEARQLIDSSITRRQVALLERFQLPTAIPNWPVDDLIEVMRRDKKNLAGRIRFILPTDLGHVSLFDDITEEQVTKILLQSQETG